VTYQWRRNATNLTNVGNVSGATTATLTLSTVTTNDASTNYTVEVSGTCSPPTNSSPATLVVNTPPSITSQPASLTNGFGTTATFSVRATGTGLTYQWLRNGTNLTDGGNVSGATTATLTLANVTSSDASTNYTVLVSGTCNPPATSSAATLDVRLLIAFQLLSTQPPGTNQLILSWSWTNSLVLQSAQTLTSPPPNILWENVVTGTSGKNFWTNPIVGIESYFRLTN